MKPDKVYKNPDSWLILMDEHRKPSDIQVALIVTSFKGEWEFMWTLAYPGPQHGELLTWVDVPVDLKLLIQNQILDRGSDE